jgi:hypothetical protein
MKPDSLPDTVRENSAARFAAMSNANGDARKDKYPGRPLIIDGCHGHVSTSGAGPMIAPAAAHQ